MPKLKALDEVAPDAMTEPEKQRILTGVADGLNYLHDRGLAHRDVHPSNILIDEEFNPYLADFAWAHACEGEPCVDFKPWECMDKAVTAVQLGQDQRGYHTIVNYLRGLPLEGKTHGFKGVPYQQVDGVGERDCQLRWDMMKPDVRGKSVLDVGCNLGWFVRKSVEKGAGYTLGIDADKAVIESAFALGGNYTVFDLDHDALPDIWRFDVAFCLSVLQHLKDPDRVLRWLVGHCETIYIEIPARFVTDYMASVLTDAQYIGESERGRPVYKVTARERVPA